MAQKEKKESLWTKLAKTGALGDRAKVTATAEADDESDKMYKKKKRTSK